MFLICFQLNISAPAKPAVAKKAAAKVPAKKEESSSEEESSEEESSDEEEEKAGLLFLFYFKLIFSRKNSVESVLSAQIRKKHVKIKFVATNSI